MRLIDADKLKEVIEKEKDDNDYMCRLCMESTKEIIDEQPTVFEVDKVVEQLEKLADEANDKILEAGGLQLYYDGYEDAMRTAVEIVKGGGVE